MSAGKRLEYNVSSSSPLSNPANDTYVFRIIVDAHTDRYNVMCKPDHTDTCVFVTVYRKPKEERSIAHIEGIKHAPSCSTNRDLPNKEGTTIMLKTMLAFIVAKFPYVKRFTFKDTSTIKCKRGISVPLAYAHFAKYGQTWYDQHFGAVPQRRVDKQYISSIASKLKSPSFKAGHKLDNILDSIVSCKMRFVNKEVFLKAVKDCWRDASTLNEFFQMIASNDCIFLQSWPEDYFTGIHRLYIHEMMFEIEASPMRCAAPQNIDIHRVNEKDFVGGASTAANTTLREMYMGVYDPRYF